ncbi:MAG: signal peptide peptidase SppA [Brumimicrobium sp.]|nr:signal peptide peptidase SppA [Brumimicrobium sp.]
MENKKVSFGRVFWPSLTAGIVILVVVGGIFAILIGSLLSGKPAFQVAPKTVLHLKLEGQIGEMSESDLSPSTLSIIDKVGLADLLYGFERAKEDDRIKGVFVELENAQCGFSTATEIRNAINDFEKSGKFVVAYNRGEAVSLKQYYIASAANESYGFSGSLFEFLGLGTELMFFKGMFDKLDLEMQVVRGSNNAFKSAVEPFFLTEMSDSSRLQIRTYLNSMWWDVRKEIGEERGITPEDLDRYADSSVIRRVADAVKYELIDEEKFRDEVLNIIAEKVKAKSPEDIKFKDFQKYAQKKFRNNQEIVWGKDANIAVIVAEGAVVTKGAGLSSEEITKLFRKARKDKNIKTIVFRINSPGGSALASDEIWREVKLANEEKKVIVSMGDVAASGGYYIAAPAHKIFAQNTTITGSIGVFGVIPYTGKMLENKLGLTFDRVSTNPHAVLTTNKKLSEEEYAMIQDEVDYVYDRFLSVVAEGRGMSKEEVNVIARGRVWTGRDAKEIGLVDEIGGLREAISYAAEQAGISKPVVRYYPKVELEPWMEIIQSLEEEESASESAPLPEEMIRLYERIKSVENMTGIQMRLPYEIVW